MIGLLQVELHALPRFVSPVLHAVYTVMLLVLGLLPGPSRTSLGQQTLLFPLFLLSFVFLLFRFSAVQD